MANTELNVHIVRKKSVAVIKQVTPNRGTKATRLRIKAGIVTFRIQNSNFIKSQTIFTNTWSMLHVTLSHSAKCACACLNPKRNYMLFYANNPFRQKTPKASLF